MLNPKLKQYAYILGLIILFLLVNLALFLKGFHEDIKWFQYWGNIALQNGTPYLYSNYITDYPPFYLFVLKFNAWLNLNLFNNLDLLTPNYIFISKTIPTLCNLAIGILIYLYIQDKNYNQAFLASCLYLFNPAIIYDAAYWGQVDAVNTLFMTLSIIFLINKKYIYSTIFIILAVLTKVQSISLVPVVFTVIVLNCDFNKATKIILTAILTSFSVLFPFIITGTLPLVIKNILNSVGRYPFVTVNSYNSWFLISPDAPDLSNTLSDSTHLYSISLKNIGFIFLAIYTLIVIYQLSKRDDEETIILAATSMTFAFFMLPTEIHERYLFPFFALLSLIVLNSRKYTGVYIVLSITFLLNLMMISLQSINIALFIALINVAIFIYFTKIGICKDLFSNLKQDIKTFNNFRTINKK